MNRVNILNGWFDALTLSEVVEWAIERIDRGERGIMSAVNVAILMMMRSHPNLKRYVEKSSLIVADGQPLIWASRILGRSLPERVTGIDLVDALCESAAANKIGVYLLGAHQSTVEVVVERLSARFPKLIVSGFSDGYFDDEEASSRACMVANSGAKILFVAMGVPRQEEFLERYWDELGVNLALGIGGSFDVIAGMRHRAPRWIQNFGLEWLYRFVQEPRRLWKRYLFTNTQFLFLLGKEILLLPFNRTKTTQGKK